MSISNGGSGTAIERKTLDSLIKVVQLLRKIERANEDLIPSASLMRKSGKTL